MESICERVLKTNQVTHLPSVVWTSLRVMPRYLSTSRQSNIRAESKDPERVATPEDTPPGDIATNPRLKG